MLTTITSLLLIITIATLYTLLKSYSILINFLRRFSKHSHAPQLTPYDSIFAIDDAKTPNAANITILYLRGNVSLNFLRNQFEKLLRKKSFAKLKQVFVKFHGYYYWEQVCVDIENHVKEGREFGLEEEGHERELDLFLGKYMGEAFEEGRPLWGVRLLRGFKNSLSVVVVRIHHTIADGYSQNFLVDELMGVRSSYKVGGGERGWNKLTAPTKLAQLYFQNLTSPPNHYTSKKHSTHGHVARITFDLNQYKEIRRATSTHFATIGMCLMCGGLRKYFLESNPPSNLPPFVSIMHSLPKPNHPLTELTNHWGVGLFKVEISTKNPLERLIKAEKYFQNYLDECYDELLHTQMPVLQCFPSYLLKKFFNLNFGTSMGFTSVPGYGGKGDVGGYEVVEMGKVFGFQWGQTAVTSAIYTYNNKAHFTIYANADIIPTQQGVERVISYIREEFSELHDAVCGRKLG